MSARRVNPKRETTGSGDDARGLPGRLAEWLVHRAAGWAPTDLSARLEEEWQADLASRPSACSRLRFAVGCCWAITAITREYRPAKMPASAVVVAKGSLGDRLNEPGTIARRSFALFFVAGLHVALFYALMTGLAFRIIKEIPTAFQVKLVPVQPTQGLPPLPPPALTHPRIEIPPSILPPTEVPMEKEEGVADLQESPTARPDTPPLIPRHDAVRIQGGPGAGFPATDDYYPPQAKRLEEQGVTTVSVCVGTDGRLTASPTMDHSSGSARLDEGALRLATAGSGHYRPPTEDGRAVSGCYAFRVRFALRTSR